MKKIISRFVYAGAALGILIPGFALAATITLSSTQTSNLTNDFYADFRVDGHAVHTTNVYAYLSKETGGTVVIKPDIYLRAITPTDPDPLYFDVLFKGTDYNLQSGTVYSFDLRDAGTSQANVLLAKRCFKVHTVGVGIVNCSTASTGSTTGTDSEDNIPYSPDVDSGLNPGGGTQATGGSNTNTNTGGGNTGTNTQTQNQGSASNTVSGTDMGNSLFKLVVDPIVPETTKANITFMFEHKGTSTDSVLLKIKYGTEDADGNVNLSSSKTAKTGSAPAGANLSTLVSLTGLTPGTKYYYEFQEEKTGSSFGVYSFTTQGTSGSNGSSNSNAGGSSGSGNANINLGGAGSGGSPVNGVCGSVNGQTTSIITATSANLCSEGTVSAFSGTGPWTWSCLGANGGTTATCGASVGADDDYGPSFLKNPLAPGLDTFPEIFEAVVNNIVLPVAVPFIAIMIIYSGLLFVSGRGNPEKMKQAKQTLMYTLIGAAVVLGAFVISKAIQATVSQLLG